MMGERWRGTTKGEVMAGGEIWAMWGCDEERWRGTTKGEAMTGGDWLPEADYVALTHTFSSVRVTEWTARTSRVTFAGGTTIVVCRGQVVEPIVTSIALVTWKISTVIPMDRQPYRVHMLCEYRESPLQLASPLNRLVDVTVISLPITFPLQEHLPWLSQVRSPATVPSRLHWHILQPWGLADTRLYVPGLHWSHLRPMALALHRHCPVVCVDTTNLLPDRQTTRNF